MAQQRAAEAAPGCPQGRDQRRPAGQEEAGRVPLHGRPVARIYEPAAEAVPAAPFLAAVVAGLVVLVLAAVQPRQPRQQRARRDVALRLPLLAQLLGRTRQPRLVGVAPMACLWPAHGLPPRSLGLELDGLDCSAHFRLFRDGCRGASDEKISSSSCSENYK